MGAPESPFERHMSERILSFAYLMCPSISSQAKSVQKTCLRFAIFNFSEKLQNIFEIGLKKIWSVRTKIAAIEKVFRNKKFADIFLLFMC